MTLDIQYKLKNNPYYLEYIRNHSNWYKLFNRNPNLWHQFEEEVKTYYKLRPSDKLKNAIETFSLIQNILSTLK